MYFRGGRPPRSLQMECLSSEQMVSYVRGGVADPHAVEAHVRDCPSCAMELLLVRETLGEARAKATRPATAAAAQEPAPPRGGKGRRGAGAPFRRGRRVERRPDDPRGRDAGHDPPGVPPRRPRRLWKPVLPREQPGGDRRFGRDLAP